MKLNPSELLKAAYQNLDLITEIPTEVLDTYQALQLTEMQKQRSLGFTPTLQSVARAILETLDAADVKGFTLSIKEVKEAPKLDLTSQQILLQAARTRASRKIMQQICALPEEDVKTIQHLENRIEQLKRATTSWGAPINIKDYQNLQKLEELEIQVAIDWLTDNNVPLKKKVLYCLITTTNGGKTILKTWMAWHLIKAGQNVLFLAQEEPHQDTIRRIHQITLGLSEDQYAAATLNGYAEIGKRYNQVAEERGYGQFFVVEWAGIKIEVLEALIKKYEQQLEICFDAIIIDYAKLVNVDGTKLAEWERASKVFEKLKELAMKQEKLIMTSMQLNRDASERLVSNNQTPDLHNVAGSYDAMFHVNYCWAVQLQRSPIEEGQPITQDTELGVYTLTVLKEKYGKLHHGDRMSFVWTADHKLSQRPGLDIADITLGL